jgi:hypothetical protein
MLVRFYYSVKKGRVIEEWDDLVKRFYRMVLKFCD